MLGGMVVPDKVERGLVGFPSAKIRAWQSIGAGAPKLAKWPV